MTGFDQCQSTVLGPTGYGDYIAWRDNAIRRGLDPGYCRSRGVEDVRGYLYCRRHAAIMRRLSRPQEVANAQ